MDGEEESNSYSRQVIEHGEESLSPTVSYETYNENVRKGYCRFLPLFFFTMCFYIGMIGSYALLPQFLLKRIAETENVTISGDTNGSSCHINKSDPNYIAEQKIQEQSSGFMASVTFISGIPSLLTVFIYGSLSDQLGRKVIITIPYIGLMFVNVALTLIINFHLPILVYLGAAFLSGLTGSSSTMLAGVFAYIADITTKEQRSLAIGIIEASLGLSMVLTNLGIGFWIKLGHFGQPMIGLTAISGVSILFLCCLRETRQKRDDGTATDERMCGNVCKTVKAEIQEIKKMLLFSRQRTTCLLLLVVGFTIHGMTYIGLMSTMVLYLMNQPFCWTSVDLGIYTAVRTCVWLAGGLSVLAIFRNRVPDSILTIVSLIMFMASLIVQGMASMFDGHTGNILILVSACIGLTEPLAPILLRSMCSKLVTADEQGAVFGLVATGESISIAFGPTIMSVVYATTVTHMEGLVFYFSGGLILVVTFMIIAYQVVSSRNERYTELEEHVN